MKTRLIATLSVAAWAAVAGCAAPALLSAPPGQRVALKLHASGVQIYQCQLSKNNGAVWEWAFKQPEADLFTATGVPIGKHYAGPTWEALDHSQVVGEVVMRANSPQARAIPWLMLSAKTTSGSGIFSPVKSIERLNTVGGAAPAEGCRASQAGEPLRVPYTADYWFYVEKP